MAIASDSGTIENEPSLATSHPSSDQVSATLPDSTVRTRTEPTATERMGAMENSNAGAMNTHP